MARPKLTEVSGIGEATAELLREHGIQTVAELAQARPATIARVPGFGASRAAAVRNAARALLEAAAPSPAVSTAEGAATIGAKVTTKKKDAKKKDKKKRKKKDRKRGDGKGPDARKPKGKKGKKKKKGSKKKDRKNKKKKKKERKRTK